MPKNNTWQRFNSRSGKLIGFVELKDGEAHFAPLGYQDGKPHECSECGVTDNASNMTGFCNGCIAVALTLLPNLNGFGQEREKET